MQFQFPDVTKRGNFVSFVSHLEHSKRNRTACVLAGPSELEKGSPASSDCSPLATASAPRCYLRGTKPVRSNVRRASSMRPCAGSLLCPAGCGALRAQGTCRAQILYARLGRAVASLNIPRTLKHPLRTHFFQKTQNHPETTSRMAISLEWCWVCIGGS